MLEIVSIILIKNTIGGQGVQFRASDQDLDGGGGGFLAPTRSQKVLTDGFEFLIKKCQGCGLSNWEAE